MKTSLFKKLARFILLLPALSLAQVDLTPGINFAYNPPTSCNNMITHLNVMVCNNDAGSAGPFLVSMYLYDPSSGSHWCISTIQINSIAGNVCLNDTNWNININNAPVVPPPGTYDLGIWVDTANTVAETNENNNTGLLSSSPDIQVCAANGITKYTVGNDLVATFPIPATTELNIKIGSGIAVPQTIEIASTSGQILRSISLTDGQANNGAIQLNVSDLQNGIYFLNIRSQSGLITKKIIIGR